MKTEMLETSTRTLDIEDKKQKGKQPIKYLHVYQNTEWVKRVFFLRFTIILYVI